MKLVKMDAPIQPRNMVIVSMRGKLSPRRAVIRACERVLAGKTE